MAKNENDYDDGRVIADMSELERRPLLFPHLHRPQKLTEEDMAAEQKVPTAEDEEALKSVRGAAIRGSLLAGLIIVAAIAVVFGLVILLIILIGK